LRRKLISWLVWGWLVSRCWVSWCWVGGLVGRCAVWGFVSSVDFLDFGVETVVVIGGVFDDAGGTVGFQKAVRSFDVTVTVGVFGLALDVVGVWVVYAVFEVVWGWGVCGFWSVSLWCGVSGLVSWGGVLGEGRSYASGEDDQLQSKISKLKTKNIFLRLHS